MSDAPVQEVCPSAAGTAAAPWQKPVRPDAPSTPAQADFERLQRLRSELAALFPIPGEATEAYRNAAGDLTRRVAAELTSRSDLSDLIGPTPAEAVHANHRHHARFMETVFTLNQPNMLLLTVPWVYRAYTAHGFALDYFPAALAAWREAVEAALPAETAGPVAEVYRWLLDHHAENASLARDEAVSPVRPPAHWSKEARSLLTALLEADTAAAMDQMTERGRTRADLVRFGIRTVQPVLYAVGSLWERGEATVAQEHLATAIISRGMAAARGQCEGDPVAKGRAVVACPAEEHHELGGRLLADALAAEGWEVAFLGGDTPAPALLDLAADLRPHLLGLSVAMPFNLLNAREAVRAVRGHAALQTSRIMVGGLALATVPEAWRQLGADGSAADTRDAVALAERWWSQMT